MRTIYTALYLLLACVPVAQAETYEPSTSVVSEPADTLSLQEAMDLALNANAEIAIALREREAVEGMQMQAAARPNPVASARMEDTRSSTRETTLEVSQPLELGNKRAMRMEAADRFYDAASAGVALPCAWRACCRVPEAG